MAFKDLPFFTLLIMAHNVSNIGTNNVYRYFIDSSEVNEKKFLIAGGNNGVWNVNTFAVGALTSSQGTMSGAGSASYIVTYKGRPVATDTQVGSFTVTWNPNANAVEGTYEATVTLLCTST